MNDLFGSDIREDKEIQKIIIEPIDTIEVEQKEANNEDESFSFTSIYDKEDAFVRIISLFEESKLHNANILHGVDLNKINTFAIDLICKILMKNLSTTEQKRSVAMVKEGTHPDLFVIKKSTNITVDQIREINSFISLRSSIGESKVIYIQDISVINKQASNAILKLLEDANKDTYFFMCTNNVSSLISTVKSRSIKHYIKSDIMQNFFNLKILDSFELSDKKFLKELVNGNISLLHYIIENSLFDGIAKMIDFLFTGNGKPDFMEKGKDITIDIIGCVWVYSMNIINPENKGKFHFPSNINNIDRLNKATQDARDRADKLWLHYKIFDKSLNLIRDAKTFHLDKTQLVHALGIIFKSILK